MFLLEVSVLGRSCSLGGGSGFGLVETIVLVVGDIHTCIEWFVICTVY